MRISHVSEISGPLQFEEWESKTAIPTIYRQTFAVTAATLKELDQGVERLATPASRAARVQWAARDRGVVSDSPLRTTHLLPGLTVLVNAVAALDPKYRLYCEGTGFTAREEEWSATIWTLLRPDVSARLGAFVQQHEAVPQRPIHFSEIRRARAVGEWAMDLYVLAKRIFARSARIDLHRLKPVASIEGLEHQLRYSRPGQGAALVERPVICLTGPAPFNELIAFYEGSHA